MTPAQHRTRFPNCRSSTLAHLIEREKMTARLQAEIEASVDRQVSAAFKTFALNTKRAFMAGRL